MSQIPGYNKTAVCPFNPSHLILMERMQTHLVKCSKNYPEIVLKKCPFNTCHLLKDSEYEKHVLKCDDRMNFDLFKYSIGTDSGHKAEELKPDNPPPKGYGDCEENWDDDEQVPTYNPQSYVEGANVIRTLNVATPSEKKAFREAERLRLKNLNSKTKKH